MLCALWVLRVDGRATPALASGQVSSSLTSSPPPMMIMDQHNHSTNSSSSKKGRPSHDLLPSIQHSGSRRSKHVRRQRSPPLRPLDGSDKVVFGGRVQYLKDAAGPRMGSGYFPGGSATAASVKNLQIAVASRTFLNLKLGDVYIYDDARECYDSVLMPSGATSPLDLYYGGPSGYRNYNK